MMRYGQTYFHYPLDRYIVCLQIQYQTCTYIYSTRLICSQAYSLCFSFNEFHKPLWLLVCCVCLLIVSTLFASMLGTRCFMYHFIIQCTSSISIAFKQFLYNSEHKTFCHHGLLRSNSSVKNKRWCDQLKHHLSPDHFHAHQ